MIKFQNAKSVWKVRFYNFDLFRNSNLAIRASHKSGFTLIETIVALTLIVGALAGPFTLATRGLFSSKFSRTKLVALNFAEEGIELVKFYRDNNVLSGTLNWDAGLGSGVGTVTYWIGDIYCDPGNFCTPATGKARNWQQCPVHPCTSLLTFDSDGLYSYSGSAASRTVYTRTITIDRNFTEQDSPPLPSVNAADRMRVVSTVTWTDSNIPRKAEVEDILYNWK